MKMHKKRTGKPFLFILLILCGVIAAKHFMGAASGQISDIEAFAKEHQISMDEYPQELLDLYERNPETKDFVCNYPLKKDEAVVSGSIQNDIEGEVPLLLQWDQQWGYKIYAGDVMGLTGCGPTCLSMVAIYLTGDETLTPAYMADFATENGYAVDGSGSAWSLFSEGGEKLGFDVTEISADQDRILENLDVGNPIVAIMGAGDFTTTGHFIVFTGTEDGKIKVNDPNSRSNSEKLWDYDDIDTQIRDLWVFRN